MIEKWHLYSFPVRNFPSAAIRMLSMGHTGRRCTCTANLSALSKWLQRISFIFSLQRLTFSIHEKYLPNTWALGCGYCCCCCTQSALCTCIFYQDWDVEAHTLLSRAKTFTVWSIFITQHAKVFTRGKMVVCTLCTQEPAYTILETVWAHNYFEVENISDAHSDGIKRALSALKMQVMLRRWVCARQNDHIRSLDGQNVRNCMQSLSKHQFCVQPTRWHAQHARDNSTTTDAFLLNEKYLICFSLCAIA